MEPQPVGKSPDGNLLYPGSDGQVVVSYDQRTRRHTIAVENGPDQQMSFSIDAMTLTHGLAPMLQEMVAANRERVNVSVQALIEQQRGARGLRMPFDPAHLRLPVDVQIGDDGSWQPSPPTPLPSQPPEPPPTQTGPRPKLGERIVV